MVIHGGTQGGVAMLSEVSTSISESLNNKEYCLSQYPNPFTNSTNISYLLATPGYVLLKVYDELGTEVAILVDEYQDIGEQQVIFMADKLPAGVYYCRLSYGKYSQTNKMILLR